MRNASRSVMELRELRDRELRDIGLSHHEIPAARRVPARNDAPTGLIVRQKVVPRH